MLEPIEVWVEKNPAMNKLLDDLLNHAENAANPMYSSDEKDEFKRHCAISLREFLKENKC